MNAQQHAEQGLGVVGGVAVPVVAVLPVEGLKVDLVDHVDEEPGEVVVGQPVAQVGWEQEGLAAVTAQEVVSHRQFFCFALFTPNEIIARVSFTKLHKRMSRLLRWQGPQARGR
jgi:hypothetical protein